MNSNCQIVFKCIGMNTCKYTDFSKEIRFPLKCSYRVEERTFYRCTNTEAIKEALYDETEQYM